MPSNKFTARRRTHQRPDICIPPIKVLPPPPPPPPWPPTTLYCYHHLFADPPPDLLEVQVACEADQIPPDPDYQGTLKLDGATYQTAIHIDLPTRKIWASANFYDDPGHNACFDNNAAPNDVPPTDLWSIEITPTYMSGGSNVLWLVSNHALTRPRYAAKDRLARLLLAR